VIAEGFSGGGCTASQRKKYIKGVDGRVPSFFGEVLVKFVKAQWMCTDKALLGDDGCLGGEG